MFLSHLSARSPSVCAPCLFFQSLETRLNLLNKIVCSFSSEGEDIIVSGVYAECSEAAAREAAYRLYLAPDPMQDQLLNATLDARHDMASVTGFNCYADR